MSRRRFLGTLSVLLIANSVCMADWTVTNVHDDSITTLNTVIRDITATDAVGWGGPHPSIAIRWAGGVASSYAPPSSEYSALTCTDGGVWGGWANFGGPVFGGPHHAMLFYGSTAVDLHSSRVAEETELMDLWGNTQVGWGLKQGNTIAIAWQGTARSTKSLHPRGYLSSLANSVYNDKIGGRVERAQYEYLAAAWEGPKRRFRLLSQSVSAVLDNSNAYYVGHTGEYNSVASQAALWPVEGGYINIHPAGALNSQAEAIDQDKVAMTARIGSRYHALVYDTFNSENPYVDLNQVLDAQFPFEYSNAFAYAVYRDTFNDRILVGGSAYSLARNRNEAMIWEYNP